MNKYRVYCETHGWQEVIASAEPTLCPVDGLSNLRASSAVVIEMEIHCNDGTPTELGLDDYKSLRYCEIDERTGELISAGYEFPPASGQMFSMSLNAQINISALNQSRDELTYPVSYNTLNDESVFSIPDSATLHGMYLTALGTKKAHLDSGTVLKDSIRAAADKAAVDAIIDNR